jgi:putative hydrolase of the HAD superfamily
MTNFDLIAFDADDTLWHNETEYACAKERFGQLLSGYRGLETIIDQLDETEMENVQTFGYGIKSFTLSMIETAVDISRGQVQGSEVQAILDLAKEMLDTDMILFDHVEDTLAGLSADYDMLMITKGDTFEQDQKIQRTGLARHFQHIEVVAEKSAEVYREILRKYAIDPARFLMVGNSLKSDVLPVIAIGGQAVYIPYQHTWAHENMIDQPIDRDAYHEIEHLSQLPDLIRRLNNG